MRTLIPLSFLIVAIIVFMILCFINFFTKEEKKEILLFLIEWIIRTSGILVIAHYVIQEINNWFLNK